MSKDEIDARLLKGRWQDKMTAFKNRTSTMHETKNVSSEDEKEVVSKNVGMAAQGNL